MKEELLLQRQRRRQVKRALLVAEFLTSVRICGAPRKPTSGFNTAFFRILPTLVLPLFPAAYYPGLLVAHLLRVQFESSPQSKGDGK
jgi:hypothetical protein